MSTETQAKLEIAAYETITRLHGFALLLTGFRWSKYHRIYDTWQYRNIFLGEDKKTTQKKIDSGEYILTDLNS